MSRRIVAMVAASTLSLAAVTDAYGASAAGVFTYRGGVVTTSCNVALSGVDDGAMISVEAAEFRSCTVGAFAPSFAPAWTLSFPSPATFAIDDVRVTFTAPILGSCLYRGRLTGTHSGSASGGTLAITGSTLTRQPGSGSLCTSIPIIGGMLALRRP